MAIRGIDVSEHNGEIDWQRVAGDDVKFVFHKVNEGTYRDHRVSASRVAAIKRAGLLVGGYDFVRPRPGRTGAEEYDMFHEIAKEVGLLQKGCLRPVIDIEASAYTGPAGPWRTRRYVKSWVERCFRRTGHHPIIYTGKWFYDGFMKGRDDFGCKLWVAAYTTRVGPYVPQAWDGHASFWQYTDAGVVSGIRGHVDLNRYLSGPAALRKVHTLGGRD